MQSILPTSHISPSCSRESCRGTSMSFHQRLSAARSATACIYLLVAALTVTVTTSMKVWTQSHASFPRKLHMCTSSRPRSLSEDSKSKIPGALQVLSALVAPKVANALSAIGVEESPIANPKYKKAEWNIPSDDFWYPPYLIGRWSVDLKFAGARFTNKVPLETLAEKDNLPGFSKYSIFFMPDIGKDISNVTLRWAQIDSHPREDHPFNIRQLVSAFLPDAQVDSAAYFFQKAPDWFHSPANRWKIKYHDSTGEGEVDLLTQKRDISVFADTVETVEYIRQTHVRGTYDPSTSATIRNNSDEGSRRTGEEGAGSSSNSGDSESDSSSVSNRDVDKKLFIGRPKKTVSDYAIRWKISSPSTLRDEFVTPDDLRKSKLLIGKLDVLVYFQPSNDLYMKVAGAPAGVYSYDVVMNRLGDPEEETEDTLYPFVWRDDGPVELDKYFGY